MVQSELLTKTRKEAPADEVARSAQLLIRAGYVAKEMAGVYSLLPLGLRVQNKIIAIIRQAINTLGGQEVALTTLQDPKLWQQTGRWDDQVVDTWFKTKLKNDTEIGLGFSHEEPLARIMKEYIVSYRDIPKYVYQFQTKFRNELRAKSGLLRGREFLMKDLYSFSATAQELDIFYEQVAQAYQRIFAAVGLGDRTLRTFASGGVFSKFSDEFQTLCPSGEDTIYVAKDQSFAVNKEVFDQAGLAELSRHMHRQFSLSDFAASRSIEVGNIFKLGTRYSEPLGLTYTDPVGRQQPVVMGSYGIGIGRLMATIVEVLADDHGLIWPTTVAPFDVHLLELNPKREATVAKQAQVLVHQLEQQGIEVLHDDRELSAGQKFADSDLIGIPQRVIVSAKTAQAKKFEFKRRPEIASSLISKTELIRNIPRSIGHGSPR